MLLLNRRRDNLRNSSLYCSQKSLEKLSRNLILLSVLVLVPIETCHSQQFVSPTGDTLRIGWIQLISEHEFMQIWVDSVVVSPSQDRLLKLAEGYHHLRVMPRGAQNWLLREFVREIEIVYKDTLNLHVAFPEFKIINSKPYGARLSINGKFVGETPLLLPKPELEKSAIRLQKFGYKDTVIVNLEHELAAIWIDLRRDPEAEKKQQNLVQVLNAKKRKDRKLALVTFGLAVTSGVASLILKDKADRSFDRYLKASNPQDMNHFFDETEKFDRLAAGSYVVFEINLVASAFFLIRSILRD